MRWSLRRSDLDFVEQKAGSKIGHVEALSWYVGTVLDGGILSKGRILQEQRKDCARVKRLENIPVEANSFWGRTA